MMKNVLFFKCPQISCKGVSGHAKNQSGIQFYLACLLFTVRQIMNFGDISHVFIGGPDDLKWSQID